MVAALSLEDERSLVHHAQTRFHLLQSDSPRTAAHHRLIRQGDRALAQLIEAHTRLIHHLTRFFQHSFPQASREDLIQEAIRAVIEAVHSFDLGRGTRLCSWVFYQLRTAFNRQKRLAVRDHQLQTAITAHAEPPQCDPIDPSPGDCVEELLAALNPYQRSVMELRLKGETFPAIARSLGKSAAAVRMAYNRAVQHLRSNDKPAKPQIRSKPSWMQSLRERSADRLCRIHPIPATPHWSLLMALSNHRSLTVLAHPMWKRILFSWQGAGIFATAIAQWLQDPFLQTLCLLYWICVGGVITVAKHQKFFARHRFLIAAYYTALAFLYGVPVFAQATGACASKGLLSSVTNFVASVFNNIKFSGSTVTSLSETICQVVGFIVFLTVITFIGVAMYVGFQVSYQQQPLTIALNPMVGFLIFAAISTVVISVMLGI